MPYLEIAPELEPYFVTGHHDDQQGLYETYGPRTELRLYRLLASTSMLVGVINAALAGAFAGLVAKTLGAGSELSLVIGAAVTSATIVLLVDRKIPRAGYPRAGTSAPCPLPRADRARAGP